MEFCCSKKCVAGVFLLFPLFLLSIWLRAKDLGLSGSIELLWSDSARSPWVMICLCCLAEREMLSSIRWLFKSAEILWIDSHSLREIIKLDVLYGFRKLILLDIRGLMFPIYYSLPLFILGIQPSKTVSFAREHIGALLHFHCGFFFPVLPCPFDMSVCFFICRPSGWNGRLMCGGAGVNGASAVGAVAVESAFGNGAAIPKGEG